MVTFSGLPSQQREEFLRAFDWPEGRVHACIAGESGVIRALRNMLHQERKIPRKDTCTSGYLKIGLVEDEHQVAKSQATRPTAGLRQPWLVLLWPKS